MDPFSHPFTNYNPRQKVLGQRLFYSLKSTFWLLISWSINFFRNWCLIYEIRKIFPWISTLQNFVNNSSLVIISSSNPKIIINLCDGPYYNLVICNVKIFEYSSFLEMNYWQNSEEWKFKEKSFLLHKSNINFWKKLLTKI